MDDLSTTLIVIPKNAILKTWKGMRTKSKIRTVLKIAYEKYFKVDKIRIAYGTY